MVLYAPIVWSAGGELAGGHGCDDGNGGPGTHEGVEAYFRHGREQWEIAGSLRAFVIRAGADEALAGTIDLRFEGEGLTPVPVR
ncbi:hypothetical protein [Streptomyces sp. 6N223]|uniref:hypothetical protein n=1 Tax=Streptomyces sp. 6N223 TaxID=3457412 RepID=UPI003FD42757